MFCYTKIILLRVEKVTPLHVRPYHTTPAWLCVIPYLFSFGFTSACHAMVQKNLQMRTLCRIFSPAQCSQYKHSHHKADKTNYSPVKVCFNITIRPEQVLSSILKPETGRVIEPITLLRAQSREWSFHTSVLRKRDALISSGSVDGTKTAFTTSYRSAGANSATLQPFLNTEFI